MEVSLPKGARIHSGDSADCVTRTPGRWRDFEGAAVFGGGFYGPNEIGFETR